MKKVEPFSVPSKKVELPSASPAKKVEPAAAEEDDDDDIDLFGSDDEEEDQEAAKVREERLRQYAEKKAKKPGLIAKSSILLDVKPVSNWSGGAPNWVCMSCAAGGCKSSHLHIWVGWWR